MSEYTEESISTEHNMINHIKNLSNSEQLKCIGLLHIYQKISQCDDDYDANIRQNSLEILQKQKTLFEKAAKLAQKCITYTDITPLVFEEFFTDEEMIQIKNETFQNSSTNGLNFWKECLMRIPLIRQFIYPQDEQILDYLKYFEVKPSDIELHIIFHFNQNPFFNDSSLEIFAQESNNDNGESEINNIRFTSFVWKEGMDPRKIKRATTEENGIIRSNELDRNSFFRIFDDYNENEMGYNDEVITNPFSKTVLFYDAKKIVDCLRYSFYESAIPCFYGNVPDTLKEYGK